MTKWQIIAAFCVKLWQSMGREFLIFKALSNLGCCYRDGRGVDQSYEKAKEWFEKAAEQGDALGQFHVGWLYFCGYGVEQDYKKSLEFWILSAEQRDETAMFNIGTLYLNGQGVEKSYEKAVEWFKKAAEEGHDEAIGFRNKKFLAVGSEDFSGF